MATTVVEAIKFRHLSADLTDIELRQLSHVIIASDRRLLIDALYSLIIHDKVKGIENGKFLNEEIRSIVRQRVSILAPTTKKTCKFIDISPQALTVVASFTCQEDFSRLCQTSRFIFISINEPKVLTTITLPISYRTSRLRRYKSIDLGAYSKVQALELAPRNFTLLKMNLTKILPNLRSLSLKLLHPVDYGLMNLYLIKRKLHCSSVQQLIIVDVPKNNNSNQIDTSFNSMYLSNFLRVFTSLTYLSISIPLRFLHDKTLFDILINLQGITLRREYDIEIVMNCSKNWIFMAIDDKHKKLRNALTACVFNRLRQVRMLWWSYNAIQCLVQKSGKNLTVIEMSHCCRLLNCLLSMAIELVFQHCNKLQYLKIEEDKSKHMMNALDGLESAVTSLKRNGKLTINICNKKYDESISQHGSQLCTKINNILTSLIDSSLDYFMVVISIKNRSGFIYDKDMETIKKCKVLNIREFDDKLVFSNAFEEFDNYDPPWELPK